jgi:hypothetical protein
MRAIVVLNCFEDNFLTTAVSNCFLCSDNIPKRSPSNFNIIIERVWAWVKTKLKSPIATAG